MKGIVNKMEDIVIIGFGGHAKSIADSVIQSGQYTIVGYTDIRDCHCQYLYLGTDEKLKEVFESGVRKVIIGIGYVGKSNVRDSRVEYAKKLGFEFPTIIDPSAKLARNVIVGEGCFVGKNAVVNADSCIGDFCIINTGAIIEHDNRIGDYTHVAVGAILCGEVSIGSHTLIGAGTTIIQGKTIGNNCIIGANSTVLADVDDRITAYGIIKGERP